MGSARILIADDQAVIRRGLRSVLSGRPDWEVCGEAVDGRDAIAKARELHPDIILLDVTMPNLNGLDASRVIRREFPESKILIVSQHDPVQMLPQALEAGAVGYVAKSDIARELIAKVQELAREKRAVAEGAMQTPGTNDKSTETNMSAARQIADPRFRFAAIVESSDDAIVSKDLNGVIITWNAAAQRIFGFTEEEAVGRPITIIIPPELVAQETEILRKIRSGQRIEHFETVRVSKTGKLVHVSLTISPVRDGSGKIIGASKIARDISARIETEKVLSESQEKLRFTLKAANVGTWEWDITTGNLNWSENMEEIYGLPPGSFSGKFADVQAWIIEEDRTRVQKALDEALATSCPYQIEYRIQNGNGQTTWLETNGQVVYDENRRPVRMMGTCRDVTARKRVELVIRQNEERFRIAQEAARIGTWEWDPVSGVSTLSPALHEMFGLEPGNPDPATQWANRVHPEDLPMLREAMDRSRILGTLEIEYRYLHPKDGLRWFFCKGGRMPSDTGPTRLFGVLLDITDRKLSLEKLEQAKQELESRVRERTRELLAAEESLRSLSGRLLRLQDEERRRIARELHDSAGQLLAALSMNLAMLKGEQENLSDSAARMLDESVEIVSDMTRELRTISHLLHPPLLDEAGLPSALRWFVEGFAERSKIPVDLTLSPELGRFSSELETALFRIVQECLTNIHRHSESPMASISVVRDGNTVTLQVRDKGKGMPAQSYLAVSGSVRPGVGIQGMRERVRQLGGRLEIDSGHGGTSVRAILPVKASASVGDKVAHTAM